MREFEEEIGAYVALELNLLPVPRYLGGLNFESCRKVCDEVATLHISGSCLSLQSSK